MITRHSRPLPLEPALLETLEPRQMFGADPFNIAGSRVVLSTPDVYRTTATADIDNDGDLDVVASAGPRIYTLLNNGSGRFTASQTFRVSGYADQLALGNFDGDGDMDLAAQGPGEGTSEFMRMYTSDGDGTWTRTVTFKLEALQVLVGNFDTDARDEILVSVGTSVKVYNTNAGIAHSPHTVFTSSEPDHSVIADVAVGDLNADGFDDAVVALQGLIPLNPGELPVAKIYEVQILPSSAQTFDRFTRLEGTIDSISIGQIDPTNSARPDIVFSGSDLFLDAATTFSVGTIIQNANGSYGSARKLYSESYDGEVPNVRMDILQVREVDGANLGQDDIVLRVQRTDDSSPQSSELRVLHNQLLAAWTSSIADQSASPSQHPSYEIVDISTQDARPDLLYWILTPGGKNKLRFAANQMIA